MTHQETDPAPIREQDISRAADALYGWLRENVNEETSEELDCLHGDIWLETAEVVIRAARGEHDTRPFTTSPHRCAPGR